MRYFCSWSVRPWNFSGSGRSVWRAGGLRCIAPRLAGLGAKQRTDGADDVAGIPALESGVGFFADLVASDVELDAAGDVGNGDERRFAHDALEHHATGDLDFDRGFFKLFAGFSIRRVRRSCPRCFRARNRWGRLCRWRAIRQSLPQHFSHCATTDTSSNSTNRKPAKTWKKTPVRSRDAPSTSWAKHLFVLHDVSGRIHHRRSHSLERKKTTAAFKPATHHRAISPLFHTKTGELSLLCSESTCSPRLRPLPERFPQPLTDQEQVPHAPTST